jgi:hypothetical protein
LRAEFGKWINFGTILSGHYQNNRLKTVRGNTVVVTK